MSHGYYRKQKGKTQKYPQIKEITFIKSQNSKLIRKICNHKKVGLVFQHNYLKSKPLNSTL